MQIWHKSVLREECLSFVKRYDVGKLVDCNLGEGGHARYFLENKEDLHIIGVDCDDEIIERARENLSGYDGRIEFISSWADSYLRSLPDESVDCVFFDLGISMFHYREAGRGFSFSDDESLDMRLCRSDALTAYDVVNRYPESKLADVIYEYSDERKSRRIARRIAEERRKGKIRTSMQLAEIVRSAFAPFEIRRSAIDVATKTFQAIRIEVNGELVRLKDELDSAARVIAKGGLIMVISFHSLEDRIVKRKFKEIAAEGGFEIILKKPIAPGDEERNDNPASRSAKLRIVRRAL